MGLLQLAMWYGILLTVEQAFSNTQLLTSMHLVLVDRNVQSCLWQLFASFYFNITACYITVKIGHIMFIALTKIKCLNILFSNSSSYRNMQRSHYFPCYILIVTSLKDSYKISKKTGSFITLFKIQFKVHVLASLQDFIKSLGTSIFSLRSY